LELNNSGIYRLGSDALRVLHEQRIQNLLRSFRANVSATATAGLCRLWQKYTESFRSAHCIIYPSFAIHVEISKNDGWQKGSELKFHFPGSHWSWKSWENSRARHTSSTLYIYSVYIKQISYLIHESHELTVMTATDSEMML
jgi:hypothetical protein